MNHFGVQVRVESDAQYGYCRDVDDIKQLTDGVYTVGYFWTQKSTVGWRSSTVSTVTVDLGLKSRSVAFMEYGAGVAGVTHSKAILIFVSSDKKTWHWQGDGDPKYEVNGKPPAGKYAVHRYHAENFSTKGVGFVSRQSIHPMHLSMKSRSMRTAENMTRPIGGKTYTDTKSHHPRP